MQQAAIDIRNSFEGISLPPEFEFTEAERRVFKPKENLTVSQWADKHRVVTKGPFPGPWSNAAAPYLIEPMDCWNLPWIRKIILRFAPQTGKTQVAFNCLCFSIDQDPDTAMYVMPDEKTSRRISRRQILPMLKASPRTAEMLSPRSVDTTMLSVRFRNGMDLMMAWATSASELASESVRYLFFDETDKYPDASGDEADPISLGEIRTTAYPHTKKILYFSTPNREEGVITRAVKEEADEIREYHAKCPICGSLQKMEFDSIAWPAKIRDPRIVQRRKLAKYACCNCKMEWDDYLRDKAVSMGKWVCEKPVGRPAAVAFLLPSWYSQFVSLSDVAAKFLRGLDDPKSMKVFVTQHKAEPWVETFESKNDSLILEHKTDLPPLVVPKSAIALTCGIDVQKKGCWFAVRAWEPDLTSHLIQYGYLSTLDDVEILVFQTRYTIENSTETMGIWRAAMDTGGGRVEGSEWSRTEEIYQWIRKNGRGYVFGIKGASRVQLKRVNVKVIDKMPRRNRPIPGGLELRILDTAQFKDLLHWRLTRKENESQRFYLHSGTGLDYTRQFLSEQKRRDRRRRWYWKQTSSENHLLDCEVYAAACADSEWLPSLSMLAASMAREDTGNQNNRSAPPVVARSKWITGAL